MKEMFILEACRSVALVGYRPRRGDGLTGVQ